MRPHEKTGTSGSARNVAALIPAGEVPDDRHRGQRGWGKAVRRNLRAGQEHAPRVSKGRFWRIVFSNPSRAGALLGFDAVGCLGSLCARFGA